jgi:hypothetical protein
LDRGILADLLTQHLVLNFLDRLHDTDTNVVRPAEYEKENPNFPGSPEKGVMSTSMQMQMPISYTPAGSPNNHLYVNTPQNVLAEGQDFRVSGFFPEGSSQFSGSQSGQTGGHFGLPQSPYVMGQKSLSPGGFGMFAAAPLNLEHFTGESLRMDFREMRENRGPREKLLGLTPARPARLRARTARVVSPLAEEVSSSGDLGLLD